MAECFEVFQDQLLQFSKQTNQNEIDFRRTSLIYSFQDFANSVNKISELRPRHVQALATFVGFNSIDPTLFSYYGLDFFDSIIRLQIITSPRIINPLQDIAWTIANHTIAKDLQNELNNAIGYLQSKDDSHPLAILRAQNIKKGKNSLDIYKSVISFYIPYLIHNFHENDLAECFQNFDIYINFLETEIEKYHAVLGSATMDSIFEQIMFKKVQLKRNAFHQTLWFLLSLLTLYERAKRFNTHTMILIDMIERIFGDFMTIFDHFIRIKPKSKYFAEGMAIIGEAACMKGLLKFPLVYSPYRRMQIFLPLATISAMTFPNTFYNVFVHSVTYCDNEFSCGGKIIGLMPQLVSFPDIVTAFWNTAEPINEKSKYEKYIALFKKFMERFQKQQVLM
ncbi:unnamed protein product [Blepharisma stoltei]|uniref:Uncharacterized protein n=1 Tax=Blepharisma stoltei TaxID=1481888 RepID=A0AAU9J4E4_9CILI|nr:unnamed protein product [Blepharisma stoltei]